MDGTRGAGEQAEAVSESIEDRPGWKQAKLPAQLSGAAGVHHPGAGIRSWQVPGLAALLGQRRGIGRVLVPRHGVRGVGSW